MLSEAAFQLGSSAYVLELIATGMLRVSFECSRHLPQLGDLAARYGDRQPELADICLIRMSELYPAHGAHD